MNIKEYFEQETAINLPFGTAIYHKEMPNVLYKFVYADSLISELEESQETSKRTFYLIEDGVKVVKSISVRYGAGHNPYSKNHYLHKDILEKFFVDLSNYLIEETNEPLKEYFEIRVPFGTVFSIESHKYIIAYNSNVQNAYLVHYDTGQILDWVNVQDGTGLTRRKFKALVKELMNTLCLDDGIEELEIDKLGKEI